MVENRARNDDNDTRRVKVTTNLLFIYLVYCTFQLTAVLRIATPRETAEACFVKLIDLQIHVDFM